MENFHKVIIIGAGPIGLYFANKCEKAGLDYFVLEGSSELGGQITHLYPEKEVVDLPGIKSIKAKDYIELLVKGVSKAKIAVSEQVLDIKPGKIVELKTSKNTYTCEKLVIATGLGTSTPRPLGVEHEKEVDNIIYNLTDFSFLNNKSIAIFGGGDSALDWAKQLSALSDDVHLIHRRMEFRGNPETIKDCKNLKIHLPFVPNKIKVVDGKAVSVTIQEVEKDNFVEIPVDYIFVNYGNIAQQSNFPFEMTGAFLNVNGNYEVSENIFAIGDVANYENKTRRMAPGILEADKVFKLL